MTEKDGKIEFYLMHTLTSKRKVFVKNRIIDFITHRRPSVIHDSTCDSNDDMQTRALDVKVMHRHQRVKCFYDQMCRPVHGEVDKCSIGTYRHADIEVRYRNEKIEVIRNEVSCGSLDAYGFDEISVIPIVYRKSNLYFLQKQGKADLAMMKTLALDELDKVYNITSALLGEMIVNIDDNLTSLLIVANNSKLYYLKHQDKKSMIFCEGTLLYDTGCSSILRTLSTSKNRLIYGSYCTIRETTISHTLLTLQGTPLSTVQYHNNIPDYDLPSKTIPFVWGGLQFYICMRTSNNVDLLTAIDDRLQIATHVNTRRHTGKDAVDNFDVCVCVYVSTRVRVCH